MEKTTKKYEIGFWAVSEQGRENIVSALENERAEIIDQGNFSRMRLAYPIKKLDAAFFGYIIFSAAPAVIKKIKDALALDKEILRTIVVFPVAASSPRNFSLRSSFVSPAAAQPQREIGMAPKEIKREIKKPKPAILSNEDLEKKLEEMLK